MSIDRYARSLSLPLPEDILKRKWAGDLEGASKAIDCYLAKQLPAMLRDRLICEKERIRRLPTQYPWNRAEAIEKLRSFVPDITDEEFDALELEGRIDFIYIHGEKRYFVRFHRTLIKFPEFIARTGKTVDPKSEWLDPMIAKIKSNGKLRMRITLETGLQLDKKQFVPGEYLAHLPFPALSAQQSDIRLEAGDPDYLDEETAPFRCAAWKRQMERWEDFTLRYSYTSEIRYADPLHAPAPDAPLYPAALPVEPADLAEDPPFIRFTPYLRALAEELAGDETEPVRKAWRFYEFVTKNVKYSFMRDYFQIDNIGEYCAVNLKGDCGLQALLFINLCRIAGIPARWQSGMSLEPDYSGSHDWAQFWLDGWGWLFCDPSYGGGAYRVGATERHAFYFGNLDPARMAANRIFQGSLSPEKQQLPVDPFDNQSGELERTGAPLPFTGRDLDDTATLISWDEIE